MIVNTEGTPRIEIGLPWTMNPELYDIPETDLPQKKFPADKYFGKYRYTNKIFANLHPVDLIPMIPTINYRELSKNAEKIKKEVEKVNKQIQQSETNSNESILSKIASSVNLDISSIITNVLMTKYIPEYTKARNIFNYYLKQAFKIINPNTPDIHYVRVYATDNTQISESISSQYEIIELGQMINSILNTDIASNIANKIPMFGELVKLGFKAAKASYVFNEDLIKGNFKSNPLSTILHLITQNKALKIDFPKTWAGTEYNRMLNLNIELSSPYGHPDAVYRWVIQPLFVLVLLGAPANILGTTGMPLYVGVKAHGLFDIPLGAIQTITIDRGGSNTKFNIYKQPLKINVTLGIVDLYSQFSIDAYLSEQYNFNAQKETTEIKDVSNYNPENDKIISSQPTFSNLVKSFKPTKDSSYEPKSSYIRSYKLINKKKE